MIRGQCFGTIFDASIIGDEILTVCQILGWPGHIEANGVMYAF